MTSSFDEYEYKIRYRPPNTQRMLPALALPLAMNDFGDSNGVTLLVVPDDIVSVNERAIGPAGSAFHHSPALGKSSKWLGMLQQGFAVADGGSGIVLCDVVQDAL